MGFFSKSKPKETHSGWVGDMSEFQEQQLAEFKELISREQLTTDPRYDDRYLLRFLRARQFDLEKTAEMFRNFLTWWAENGVDTCLWTTRFPEMPELKELYIHGYHGTDRDGRPVYYDCPAQVKIDDVLHKVSLEWMEQYY